MKSNVVHGNRNDPICQSKTGCQHDPPRMLQNRETNKLLLTSTFQQSWQLGHNCRIWRRKDDQHDWYMVPCLAAFSFSHVLFKVYESMFASEWKGPHLRIGLCACTCVYCLCFLFIRHIHIYIYIYMMENGGLPKHFQHSVGNKSIHCMNANPTNLHSY